MRRSYLTSVMVLLCFLVSGCSLLMQGPNQLVSVISEPSDAKVTVDGQSFGTTPVFVKLERKYEHIVQIELDGFEPYKAVLSRKVSGWVWGNIIFGGIPGLIVDHATGSLYKLEPWQVSAEFKKQFGGSNLPADGLFVVLVPRAAEGLTKIGQLSPVFLSR